MDISHQNTDLVGAHTMEHSEFVHNATTVASYMLPVSNARYAL